MKDTRCTGSRGRRALLLGVLTIGCAPLRTHPVPPSACPAGSTHDARATSLTRLLHSDPEAAELARTSAISICFVPGIGRGVLSGELVLLEAGAPDPELSARLAHLLVHRRDNLGNGCAQGLAAARDSERRAQQLEARLRARYGLPMLSPVETEIAERDYLARCPATPTKAP